MNKPILISAGDFAGINPYLLFSVLPFHSDTEFHITISEHILKQYADLWQREIPGNLVCIQNAYENGMPLRGERGEFTSKTAAMSLNHAVEIMKTHSDYAGLITMPVDKREVSRYISGFKGHTEYIGKIFASDVAMILYAPEISVSPVTTHIPIKNVSRMLSEHSIIKHISIVNNFYTEYMHINPKITFVCINPHCSDEGLLGNEDILLSRIIREAEKKFIIKGPMSSDTAFLPMNREHTDIFICPYHDQGLIPFKMLAFDTGINITAGLPFIRVSPDHGPAYDMAFNEGLISPGSFNNCIDFIKKRA